jgi:GNAT superfamily N-acetyltransferase
VSGVTVRQTTADDWKTWRDLRLRALQDTPTAFGSTYERELAFTEDDWRDRAGGLANAAVLGTGTAGPSLLAFVGDVAVGMGGGFRDLPGWLHVVAMWTDPAWRGHGAGSAVLEHLKAWSAGQGLRVHLDVETGNQGARRLYERAGFVATGETRPLRDGSPYEVERMVLETA